MSDHGSLSGGKKLLMIRERKRLIQSEFDLSSVITQKNYSKIETGKAAPSRAKLDAILDLLQATFNERRDVLSAFGYLPPYPIPDPAEVQAACERCRPVLDKVPMPAYLMDFLTRFLAWNACFARLLGDQETSGALRDLQNMPLFKAQFDSRVRLADYIEDMEPYLLAEMQAIRERLAPYRDESWYAGYVAELCEEPSFNQYWQATKEAHPQEERVSDFAAQITHPVAFSLPGSETQLHFYANLDPLIGDDRFHIVYLIPADAFTLRQVERWVAEL